MKDVFGSDGLLTDAALGERDIFGNLRIQVMTDHQHVEMLGDRVHGQRSRGIGRRRQDVRKPRNFDDVGSVAAAGAFGVIGVDGPAADGGDGVVDKPGFIQRVGVDGDLNIELVGDLKASVDCSRGGSPILVQLQTAGSCLDLFSERIARGGISLPQKSEIHWPRFSGAEHLFEIPTARCASCGIRASRWAGAAADHGRSAVRQSFVDLLRRNEVNMLNRLRRR